jgi:hypothetical protein
VAKVLTLLWRYADLRKVVTFDVSARDDLDHYDRLRIGVVQGCRPWGVKVGIDLTGVEATAKRCK